MEPTVGGSTLSFLDEGPLATDPGLTQGEAGHPGGQHLRAALNSDRWGLEDR